MNPTRRFAFSLLAAVFTLLLFPHITAAQSSAESTIWPNDYGTSGTNYLMIPGTDFVPSNSATGFNKPFLFLHRTGGGDTEFTRSLTLPPGALLQSVTAYVIDSSATQDVVLRMCILCASPTGAFQNLDCDDDIGVPAASTSGSPGGTALVLNPNRTFKNLQDVNGFQCNVELETSHVILVHLGAPDNSNLLHSVKVQWKRQISPAPPSPTFSDVPTTHPFYQFIEALAASGVTAGCTGPPNPNYCPDATLTRGQMAVFLARALGLHWVP